MLAFVLALGLMLWMTGSGINIFTIMFTVMAMVNPIKSIAQTNQQFQRFSDGGKLDLTQQKFTYVALHLVALGVGLWKVRCGPFVPSHPAQPSAATSPVGCDMICALPNVHTVSRPGALANDRQRLGNFRDGGQTCAVLVWVVCVKHIGSNLI